MPSDLNLLSGVFLINSNILLIFDGKMAKIKPTAIMNSFTILLYFYFLRDGLTDLPKNLKKSLSGDKTKEVSPPIKAFS